MAAMRGLGWSHEGRIHHFISKSYRTTHQALSRNQTRGHVVSEDRLTQTSAGVLVVTNQRIVLQPSRGNKPVSIPLAKVLSYNCYNNGIEVYKEGREKGYLFSVKDSGAVELFGICLTWKPSSCAE
jgi:hypothetical protein